MAISKNQPMRPALNDVIDGVDSLNLGLTAETEARENADGTLQDNIDAVNAIIGSGFDSTNTVAAALDSEETARESADDTLQDNIDAINAIIGSGFDSTNTVAAAIDSEETARENADGTLQDNIDAINAIIGSGFDSTNTVAAAIDSEETARENADNTLDNKIDQFILGFRIDNISFELAPEATVTHNEVYTPAFQEGREVILIWQLNIVNSDISVDVTKTSTGFTASITNSSTTDTISFLFNYFAIGV